jgi:hypothetical protein
MLLPANYLGHATLDTRAAPVSLKKQPATFASMYQSAVLRLQETETIPENDRVLYRESEDADGRVREKMQSAADKPGRRSDAKDESGPEWKQLLYLKV